MLKFAHMFEKKFLVVKNRLRKKHSIFSLFNRLILRK